METLHNKSIKTDRQLALSAPTHISKQMQMEHFASRSIVTFICNLLFSCLLPERSYRESFVYNEPRKRTIPFPSPRGKQRKQASNFFLASLNSQISDSRLGSCWRMVCHPVGHCNGIEDYIFLNVWFCYWRQQITKLGIKRLGLCSCCVSVSHLRNLSEPQFLHLCNGNSNTSLLNNWVGVIKWNTLQTVRGLSYIVSF